MRRAGLLPSMHEDERNCAPVYASMHANDAIGVRQGQPAHQRWLSSPLWECVRTREAAVTGSNTSAINDSLALVAVTSDNLPIPDPIPKMAPYVGGALPHFLPVWTSVLRPTPPPVARPETQKKNRARWSRTEGKGETSVGN